MGLPKGLKKLLKSPVLLHRKTTIGRDAFGNPILTPAAQVLCVIGQTTAQFGTAEAGSAVKTTSSEETMIYFDAIDVRVGDTVELPLLVGINVEFDNIQRRVSNVITYRDKRGLPLLQEATVVTI